MFISRQKTRLGSLAVAAGLLTLVMAECGAVEQHDTSVIGQWKLTAVLDSAEVSGLDDEEAQQLVGKTLKIEKGRVQIADQVCSAPDFEAVIGDRDDYLKRRAHANAARLGLPDPVTSVHISCAYVYKKASNRLVLNWQGVLFDAVRVHRR